MERIKSLIVRYWPSGTIFIGGIFLIIYIALGILYLQQGGQQSKYEEQINSLSIVVSRPLASSVALQEEYDEVNANLAPIEPSDAIEWLVNIAEDSGIDTNPEGGKFHVPSAAFRTDRVGGGVYKVMSFNNIRVQGSYDDVMDFILDLDSGNTIVNLVLTKVNLSWSAVGVTGEEAARRVELGRVESAVLGMMLDNELVAIPHPNEYYGGIATNVMGDDPDTDGLVEGFPDIVTTPSERGYTGLDLPRNGYVLWQHDKISTDNTSQYSTVNYISDLFADYYYTCESDGTIRQFDGPDSSTATEYVDRGLSKTETIATMNVDIYTNP
ncbi:hypothetical protein ACFLTT_03170 [Chloroflexota bacterium]